MAYSGDRTEGRSQNSTVRCRDSERYLSQEPLTSKTERSSFSPSYKDPVASAEMLIADSVPDSPNIKESPNPKSASDIPKSP